MSLLLTPRSARTSHPAGAADDTFASMMSRRRRSAAPAAADDDGGGAALDGPSSSAFSFSTEADAARDTRVRSRAASPASPSGNLAAAGSKAAFAAAPPRVLPLLSFPPVAAAEAAAEGGHIFDPPWFAPRHRGKVCAAEGCGRQPSFGFPDDDYSSRCAGHKTPGMQDIVNKRRDLQSDVHSLT